MKQSRTLLAVVEKRLSELGKLIQSIYEDKVMGRIPENVCIQLMNQYEAERTESWNRKRSSRTNWRRTGRRRTMSSSGCN